MDNKKNMYREMVMKTTINLYAQYGIRGVSMGQIAGTLRISKKTLYEEFGNKEMLLCSCIDYDTVRLANVLEATERESTNPVETIIFITHNLFKYRFYFCSSFYKDIFRFKAAAAKLDGNFQQLAERYCEYLDEGCKQGYFQPELDCITTATVLIELLSGSESSNNAFLVYTFLRGLCTDKGIEVMNSLTPGNAKKEVYNYN